ncbi:MAG: FAD-dependent oxidoreductase [Bdellovibrionota bacterium]
MWIWNATTSLWAQAFVGLAVAAECAKQGRTTVLPEQHLQFGQETSSRNSEVIHSGIYYPVIPSNPVLFEWARETIRLLPAERRAAHVQTGKYVIATTPEESAYLDKLLEHARGLDVPVSRVSGKEVQSKEPLIRCVDALFSPEPASWIHTSSCKPESELESQGGLLGYRHTVQTAQRDSQGFLLQIQSPQGALVARCQRLFNAAGLGAATLSNSLLQSKSYEHRYCRGRYFTLSSRYLAKFHSLVYPVPQKDGLGVHVTVDCEGHARLGPDVDWVDEKEYGSLQRFYDCDWDSVLPQFLAAVRKYCPSLEESALSPGLIGIRPKLFIDGKQHTDFLVEGFEGFVHLLGIESPGLTAALAIAPYAASLQA